MLASFAGTFAHSCHPSLVPLPHQFAILSLALLDLLWVEVFLLSVEFARHFLQQIVLYLCLE